MTDSRSHPTATVETHYVPAPVGAPEDTPRVFAVINAVMRDTTPVGKDQVNEQQRYRFRGIDDLMSAVAGPMRAHGLFIVPALVEHALERRGERMTSARIRMRYHLYGPAGDALVATVPGEAADYADKATNKAMSAAMKYLLLQVLMIPIDARSIDDGDRDHPIQPPPTERAAQQPRRSRRAEPGPWETSAAEQQDMVMLVDRQAQAIADKAKDMKDRASIKELWRGEAAQVINAGIIAPDTGERDVLGTYLERHAATLPETNADESTQAGEEPADAGPAAQDEPDEHAAAEAELRQFAEANGLTEIDADFEQTTGLPLRQAGARQIREFLSQLTGTTAD